MSVSDNAVIAGRGAPSHAVGAAASPARIGWHKRPFDLLFLLFLLPAAVPLMTLLCAYIRVVSSGRIFFRQQRVGFDGRLFTLLKFRTMREGADTAPHRDYVHRLIASDTPMRKMDQLGDTRLIPGGAILRATGLDELPQLINVVRGEMSIVGPRPCTLYEFEAYDSWHKERLHALPGLTGLWQVNGKNRTTFNEMIQMDIHYARRQSLWLDVRIILKTVPAIAGQILDAQFTRGSGLRRACLPGNAALPGQDAVRPQCMQGDQRANG